MLSLVFVISLKFFRTNEKVVINSFCCFLFLNYGEKVGLLRVTRLMPKARKKIFQKRVAYFLKDNYKNNFSVINFILQPFFKLLNWKDFFEKS